MRQKRALAPAARRALRLHRRVRSFSARHASDFAWLAGGVGKLNPGEGGARHELWEALGDLEHFLFWSGDRGVAEPPRRSGKWPEAGSGAALATRLPGGIASGQGELLRGSGTRCHGDSDSLPSSRLFLIQDRGPSSPRTSWQEMVQERHNPARWSNIRLNDGVWNRHAARQGGWTAMRGLSGGKSFTKCGAERQPEEISRAASAWNGGHVRRDECGGRLLRLPDQAVDTNDRRARTPLRSLPISPEPPGRFAGMPATESDEFADTVPEDRQESAWPYLVSQSRGTTLGIFQRVHLEPFFPGLDLSEVRIHADESSDRAARSLRAAAFSLGMDIFFQSNRFRPFTSKGLALLAHELVHARQMNGCGSPAAEVKRETMEHEAEAMEASVLRLASPDGGARNGHSAMRMGGSAAVYAPLSLEPARPACLPDYGRSGSVTSRAFSLPALPGSTGGSHPLKAEEGRPVASEPAGRASSPSSTDDQEGMTRALFRALERKIRTEKERRGVDRWEH